MSEPLRVAIAGLGTVGSGTVKLLQQNAEALAERCGRAIEITAVADPDRRDRGFPVDGYRWYDDGVAMAREAPADVVVELIGGSEGPARRVAEAALAAGRHLVTANKALIAHHGLEPCPGRRGRPGPPRLRGGGRRRHPDHQEHQGGACRQPLLARLRHPQRHLQLHPHRHARGRPRVPGSPFRGAGAGLRRGRSRPSTSTASTRRTSWRSSPPSPSAAGPTSAPSTSRGSATSRRSTSPSPRSWATASSCSASPP